MFSSVQKWWRKKKRQWREWKKGATLLRELSKNLTKDEMKSFMEALNEMDAVDKTLATYKKDL